MKTLLPILVWLLLLCLPTKAQITSHRMNFHYRLTQRKLDEIGDSSQQSYPLYVTRLKVRSVREEFKVYPSASGYPLYLTRSKGGVELDTFFLQPNPNYPYLLYIAHAANSSKRDTFKLHPNPAQPPYPRYISRLKSKTVRDTFRLCPTTKMLKVLISNADAGGALKIDPWSVVDYRTNVFAEEEIRRAEASKKATTLRAYSDPCFNSIQTNVKGYGGIRFDTLYIINANTPHDLVIQLPARKKVGHPVTGPWLHYQSIIISINAIAFKTRPRVTDYKGTTYNSFLASGNFNLGLSIGKSFGWTKFTRRSSNSNSLTIGGNLGLSGAKLKDEPLTRYVDVASIPNSFVFSPAGTITAARNDIGIIFAFGIDHMLGNASSAWAYQNKFFFGFGVSAGFKL